ncbi:MAG: methylenetetrahydrofolate reductase [Chloroflexi bacterium]|nr:methylenetetrahydrofolate reductase [Chloroflexota bacterium]
MKSGSHLERLLDKGTFVVTGELGPPKSVNREVIERKVGYLKGMVDAVNITDNQTAIARMSSVAAGVICVQTGLEPIVQMVCRDKNRLALQSDVMGAYALGIRNILCLTGDHQCFGNHPECKNVFDLDAVQFVQMVKTMRDEKKFQSGEEMKMEPRVFIGAAANPFADPFEFRVIRMEKKINAGADFIQTQPVFDLERFERFMELARKRNLHKRAYILAGVMPVKSVRALTYMRDSVPGVIIPEDAVERMGAAADGKEEGKQMCIEMIKKLKDIEGVAGIHIMAVEWEQAIPEIVEKACLLPRPPVEAPPELVETGD